MSRTIQYNTLPNAIAGESRPCRGVRRRRRRGGRARAPFAPRDPGRARGFAVIIDLTAHALRAINVWCAQEKDSGAIPVGTTSSEFSRAIERGFSFLTHSQRSDGSWVPLWFGNQDHPSEENPTYGTAKVLMAYRDFNQTASPEAQRGLEWLRQSQNDDGGWGGGASIPTSQPGNVGSSVEETALAVEALLMDVASDSTQKAVAKGLRWLVDAVESGAYLENSPIGFYFAKLWYHETLYPLVFTVAALGRALAWSKQPSRQTSSTARLTC